MSSGSLQPEGQKRAGAAGPEHQSRAQDKAGKHKEAPQHCAQRDRFLLAPSLKSDCNRAGEVKSIWAQLVDILQQSQVRMCLCWCEPHDSGSPGRQPWAQHWVHQALETRGIETPSASDSVSPLTQTLRREPRSPQPLPGLWSLHCAERGNNQQLHHKIFLLPLGVIPFPGTTKSILSATEPNTTGSRAYVATSCNTTMHSAIIRTNSHISLCCHSLAKQGAITSVQETSDTA